MSYHPNFGLLVAMSWTPLYQLDPSATAFGEPLYDFKAQIKRVVPFRDGFMTLLKEGPAVQFLPDEVCVPGTAVSTGSLLSVASNDHAIVTSFREDPKRVVRWIQPQ